MKESTKTGIQNYSFIIASLVLTIVMCKWLGIAGFLLSLIIIVVGFFLIGAIAILIDKKRMPNDVNASYSVNNKNRTYTEFKSAQSNSNTSSFNEAELYYDETEVLNVENLVKNEAYTSGNLHMELYYPKDRKAIESFLMQYDLSSVESILKIPVPNYKRQALSTNVPTEPEQILQRQATYYKKVGKMDLAIACLKKSNEFMKTSFYMYQINDYMRLVDFMYYNSQFEEAKKERKNICEYFNNKTEIDELTEIMNTLPTMGERKAYYKRVIEPRKEKMHDKEEYYWFLENLPNNAPKSFSGYRRMKKNNTENYKKLISLALEKGYVLEQGSEIK